MEMLRIISMLMIIASHFAVHGQYNWGVADISIPHLWITVLSLFGKIGVNLFVLISGYYLVKGNSLVVKPEKILKYLGQVYFYSIGIFLTCKILSFWNHIPFIWHETIIFPILNNLWWFASVYFWMFLTHGFLNPLLQKLTRANYQKLILLLLVCFCLIPSVIRKSYHAELLWFVILYIIAGYLRLYGMLFITNKKSVVARSLLAAMTILCISVILRFCGIVMEEKIPAITSHSLSLGEMHNIFTVLISLFLFMAFMNIKMSYIRLINTVAASTFGVYLIHEHPVVRDYLWKTLFYNPMIQHTGIIIPYSLMAILFVFCACTIVDMIRKHLFEQPFMKIIHKTSIYWIIPIKKFFSFLQNIVFCQ